MTGKLTLDLLNRQGSMGGQRTAQYKNRRIGVFTQERTLIQVRISMQGISMLLKQWGVQQVAKTILSKLKKNFWRLKYNNLNF